MAIKVKHDMNAAPAAAAGVASGRAKRSVETAKLFAGGTGSGSRGGGTTGATAHPVSPMGASAQLTHASAPAVSAHAPAYHDTIDDRMRLQDEQNRAALERQQLGIDAAQKRLDQTQEFTAGQNKEERDWRAQQEEEKRKAQQLGIDASMERLIQQQTFTGVQNDLERNWRAQQEEAKRKAAQEEWDRQHNILRTEHDADLVAAGTHEWGYSPQAEQQINEMQDAYQKAVAEGLLSEEDAVKAKAELEAKIAAIPKTAVRRKDPKALLDQNTYVDENGVRFSPDGKVVYNPAEMEIKRQEYEAKRLEALRMQAQRYEESLRKPRKISRLVDDEDVSGGKRKEDFYEERSEEEILGLLQKRFPSLYPSDTPHPSVQQPSAAPPVAQAPAPVEQQERGVQAIKPLPENATPEQARSYAEQFKRKKKQLEDGDQQTAQPQATSQNGASNWRQILGW